MDKIKEILGYIQSIETAQIIDFIIAISVLILFFLFSSSMSYLILRIFFKKDNKEEIKDAPLYKTIRTFLNLLGIYIAIKIVIVTEEQNKFIDTLFRIIIIWTIANIISGAIKLRSVILTKIESNKSKSKKDKFTADLVTNLIKFILYSASAYISLKELGYDLGGFAAGLGIGGAIIALAAQNLVKQILAGLAIISDKPFEIGDYINVDEISGTVESITWRSTKIRTIDDTIVTIDNSELILSKIINWGKIEKRVFKGNIRLALETEEAVIEKIVNRIKFILKYNDDIIKDSINVQLKEIETDCLNINIFLQTTITNYKEYLEFCNKINLTLLNILETQGVSLAYPGQNIYLKELKEHKPKTKAKPVKISKKQ